jgi:hypothetical protein
VPHCHNPLPGPEALRIAQLDEREIAGLHPQGSQVAVRVPGQDLSRQRAPVKQSYFERTAFGHMGVGDDQALWVPDGAGPIASSTISDMNKAAMDAFYRVCQVGVQFR